MTNLKPSKIFDIISRMDEYLTAMSSMEKDNVIEFLSSLEDFVRDYFKNHTDELELRGLLVQLVNMMYLTIANFDKKYIHTEIYFNVVIHQLFRNFQQKNIFAFFILDNSLRDDRFKLAVELFKNAGFSTIFPYSIDKLQYSDKYSNLPKIDYKIIEKQIDESKTKKKHIFYLEKDDSVNYLNDILAIAEEFQLEYVCIFRHETPDIEPQAIWLTGSFSDYLNEK